jgi:ubiquinone/menaquinone biosynthesis C-methylase UbiE
VVSEAKQQQKAMWDAAAPTWEKWDNWFQRQTHSITDWICRSADARSGHTILDIAAGSGQPALTLARLVRPNGSIVATDISGEMLRVAKRKANQADLDNVEFKEMDAESLDFPDDTFDSVTCRWGLMSCPDVVKAISEARRVLKPNRPFVATTWAGPEQAKFVAIPMEAISAVAPEFAPAGGIGPLRLSDAEQLRAMAKEAGFSSPEVESRPVAFEFNSLDEAWQTLSEFIPPLAAALQQASEQQKAAIKEAVLAALGKYREGGKVRVPSVALGLYGQK